VDTKVEVNESSQYRKRKEVFPTEELPMIRSLNTKLFTKKQSKTIYLEHVIEVLVAAICTRRRSSTILVCHFSRVPYVERPFNKVKKLTLKMSSKAVVEVLVEFTGHL
jgi:hypothetical protein